MNTRVVSMLMLVSVLASYAVSNALADDEVYLFAIGDYDNRVEYLDPESHQIRGYYADIINAVCDIADKNCELVWDVYNDCWDAPTTGKGRGGKGLMSKWYTACTGWPATYERLLTFDFTIPISQESNAFLYARRGSTQDYSDLSELKVGFLSGWWSDAACLASYTIVGADLPSDSQKINFYTLEELIAALNNGTVDVVFSKQFPQLDDALDVISPTDFPNKCVAAGPGMMTQKSNKEFVSWWNEAFTSLVGTDRYDTICQNIVNEHGDIPGGSSSDICIANHFKYNCRRSFLYWLYKIWSDDHFCSLTIF